MDELLAKQREEMEEHMRQMDAMTTAITVQVAAHMTTYEAQICTIEGSRLVNFEPEVTNERALHDLGSLARLIVKSSIDSTQGNNILFFIII
jgi:hypothetical protein